MSQSFIYYLKQYFLIFMIGFLATPNCIFYASSNIMSDLLKSHFNNPDLPSLSYTLVAVPSIFALTIISLLIDAFSTVITLPILTFVSALSTALCAGACYNRSSALFLAGRALFGLVGECVQTSQSKLISILTAERLQPTAYAVAFIGQIVGDLISSATLPITDLKTSFFVILALQGCSFLVSFWFSILVSKQQKLKENEKKNCQLVSQVEQPDSQNENLVNGRENLDGEPQIQEIYQQKVQLQKSSYFKNLKQELKQVPGRYFATLPVRFMLYTAKASFDTLSNEAFAAKLHVSQQEAKKYIMSQAVTSILSFALFSVLSTFTCRIEWFVLLGQVVMAASFGYFFCNLAVGWVVSIGIGIAFGAFTSNVSSILVKQAGKELGATALGFCFSIEYLMMAGVVPLSSYLGRYNYDYCGLLYLVMVAVSIVFMLVVMAKWFRKAK